MTVPASGQGSSIRTERLDSIAVLRFANPPQNFMTVRNAAALSRALEAVLADSAVRAIILASDLPGVFVRHADVGEIVRSGRALGDGRARREDFARNAFIELGAMIEGGGKPVIAAIDGVCMGGGLEIALACTMRIAAHSVREIGLPEIRLGIVPGAGGLPRLARLIGPHRARLLALSGTVMDASQALAAGIVDELADNALVCALAWAERFAGRHPAAVATILKGTEITISAQESARAFSDLLLDDAVMARLERFLAADLRLEQLD